MHDPLDPEYSILKQRLARRVRYEGLDPSRLSLVDITHVAERTITGDLEYLIEQAVDAKKANYALVTGGRAHMAGRSCVADLMLLLTVWRFECMGCWLRRLLHCVFLKAQLIVAVERLLLHSDHMPHRTATCK